MFGAMTKTYFAEREGLNKDNIVVVSVMPCTAKKYENGGFVSLPYSIIKGCINYANIYSGCGIISDGSDVEIYNCINYGEINSLIIRM